MTKLRFGVIGCGAIATLHQLPALRRARAAELVAVVDSDGAWAARVAERFRIAVSATDYRDLIGRVDAVLIATPNHTHAEIACAFLQAGVHVLCEKPLATTRRDVERMLHSAEQGGARLMAAHCLRFSPNVAMLKEIVAANWLGELTDIAAAIGGPYERSARRTDFRRQKQCSGGGVLVDLGVHVLDLAVWLAAQPAVDVMYHASTAPGWEVETDAEVAVHFAGGARARLTASFTRSLDAALTLRGRDGWATASLYRPSELTLYAARARVCRAAGVQHLRLQDTSMYDAQLEHFCAAVTSGEPFRVRTPEIRAVVDVIDRCYGQPVVDAA
jgi:predicted dehydrogenase